MPVTNDIVRTYKGPRRVVRDLLSMGQREDRAIAWLMIGCVVVFVSRLPALQRQAVLDGSNFQQEAIYAFFALLMIAPLLFYGLAFIAFLIAKVFGGKGTAYGARLAVFWGWLAATPLALFYGMLVGFNGTEHPGTVMIGGVWLAVLALFWLLGLVEISKDR